jgi:PKD repeat protein
VASENLSKNACDIESQLFGIGSTNLETPKAPCVAELCYGVVVNNPCNLAPSFNYSPAPNQNNTFLFTNTTLTANAPQVTWTFGDSTTASGNVVTHSFTDPGTYWVCMHVAVSNSCYADTCMFVVVNSNPQPCNLDANFIWQTTPQNSTSTANAVYFLNTSLGYMSGDSITWNFGDGSTSNQANFFCVATLCALIK